MYLKMESIYEFLCRASSGRIEIKLVDQQISINN